MIDPVPMPDGWELAGRVLVMIGLAGLLGLGGRLMTVWLRKRRIKSRAGKLR